MSASTPPSGPGCTRRHFLSTSAKLGTVILAAPHVARAAVGGPATVNVALVGCGLQGRVLLNAALRIPGVRFRAVCDIWPRNRVRAERLLGKFGHDVTGFENHAEMLATVRDLDAVLVATPDFVHAEHTNAGLRAGKHVYCEKLMAHTVEAARSMVLTARETGKLLQIGHQRRSNPRYRHARDRLVREARLFGRITQATAQWNRAVAADFAVPATQAVPEATLQRYGYANLHEFLNWRWFRRYSGGPISDLGAHQIDIFNWMLGANPSSVLAGGGADYYRNHEWYDNVVAIYEFPTADGVVRATYQVSTTTSAGGGYHEYFMGDQGALKISEDPANTAVYREAHAPDWDPLVAKGLVARRGSGQAVARYPWEKPRPAFALPAPRKSVLDVRETAALAAWDLPVRLDQPIHQPHLENFFAAIREGTPLACPAESAFATAVTVLSVNDAVAARRMLTLRPEDFLVTPSLPGPATPPASA
ncbi:Gfo/Idh/MocA family oxidoreductase [Opitutus sp. ER46]|uniref:Gfo/Idh/MocA family oxidoreductase n=1 Tax=Opitutus sp. ER46 TaxID=2161864 RepID=UPI000D3125F0|nr:Gfo/Idh/MocA family oxidoreductase [Opitutus sp. ER46]PTX95607.1 gfo/Idh/MocA family oxidoreductase [Opitutus sp. ER46]